MCFICFITNDNIGRFQISMNIALRMDRIQPIHQLQSDDDTGLNREFAFLKGFFEFFQIDTKQLHY